MPQWEPLRPHFLVCPHLANLLFFSKNFSRRGRVDNIDRHLLQPTWLHHIAPQHCLPHASRSPHDSRALPTTTPHLARPWLMMIAAVSLQRPRQKNRNKNGAQARRAVCFRPAALGNGSCTSQRLLDLVAEGPQPPPEDPRGPTPRSTGLDDKYWAASKTILCSLQYLTKGNE